MYRWIKQHTPPYREYQDILRRLVGPRIGRCPCEIDPALFKKSDTLFVLGCGHSINRLDEAAWREIRSADSFGFNLWLYHDHVPTYYMDEFLPPEDEHFARLSCALQKIRKEAYAKTLIIVKDYRRLVHYPAALEHYAFLDQPHLVIPYSRELKGGSVGAFRRCLRWMDGLGAFRVGNKLWYWPTKRASVVSILLFAVGMGYRKVIFCGIDLNTPYYFFRARRYRESGLPQLPPADQFPDFAARLPNYYAVPDEEEWMKRPAGAVHGTLLSAPGKLSVLDALTAVRDVVVRGHGLAVSTAFRSSALYPTFPSYFD